MKKWLIALIVAVTILSCDVYYVEETPPLPTGEDESSSFEYALEIQTSISGGIQYSGDIDYYFLYMSAGETYRIHMKDINGFEPVLGLYNSSYTLIVEKGPGIGTSGYNWWGYNESGEYLEEEKESILYTAELSGIYYLSVEDLYSAHDYGTYSIQIEHEVNVPKVENLQIAAQESSLELSWDILTSVSGYRIYRAEVTDNTVGEYQQISQIITKDSATYMDNAVSINQRYSYYICAFIDEEQGPASDAVEGLISMGLDSVQNLSALAMNMSNFEIQISWDAVTDAEGYRIYRALSEAGDYSLIQDQSATLPCLYTDTDIMANIHYYYTVEAYFRNVTSDLSESAEAYFDWSDFRSNMDIIDASQGLTGRIEIRFEEKYSNASILRYDIYRAEDEENPLYQGPIGSFSSSDDIGSIISDTDIDTGRYYFYCVKIILDTDEGEASSDYSWFDSGRAE